MISFETCPVILGMIFEVVDICDNKKSMRISKETEERSQITRT